MNRGVSNAPGRCGYVSLRFGTQQAIQNVFKITFYTINLSSKKPIDKSRANEPHLDGGRDEPELMVVSEWWAGTLESSCLV
jgi:hypothetical protein